MSDKEEKAARLAAALRENLKRRRVQARAGGGSRGLAGPKDPPKPA